MSHVIIEADTPNNANLRLGRLDVTLRGRLSCNRGSRQTLAVIADRYQISEIPGQRLRLDFDSDEITVIEPLHFDEHRALREQLEKRWTLPRAEESRQTDKDVAWFWMWRAVESKVARVVDGGFPRGKPPQDRGMNGEFEPPKDAVEVMASAIATSVAKEVATSVATAVAREVAAAVKAK